MSQADSALVMRLAGKCLLDWFIRLHDVFQFFWQLDHSNLVYIWIPNNRIWNSTTVHWLLFVRRLSWGRTYVFFHSKRFQHFGLRLIETQKDWEFPSRRHSYLVHPKWSHFNFSWASKDCALADICYETTHTKKRTASVASLYTV